MGTSTWRTSRTGRSGGAERVGQAGGPRAVFHSVGAAVPRLSPGGTIRLGRSARNDVVLRNPTVSRFHAIIAWEVGHDLPRLRDVSSHNGTLIDGARVPQETDVPLQDGRRVTLGTVELRVGIRGAGEPADPTLEVSEEGDSRTKLCFACGPDLVGWLGGPESIWEVLLLLERERRTGVLELGLVNGKAALTFGLGRVIYARAPEAEGREAVQRILASGPDTYFRFSKEFEVRGGRPLDLAPSDLLRLRSVRNAARVVPLRAAG